MFAAPVAGMHYKAQSLHALLLVVHIDGGISDIDLGDHVCTMILADDVARALWSQWCRSLVVASMAVFQS